MAKTRTLNKFDQEALVEHQKHVQSSGQFGDDAEAWRNHLIEDYMANPEKYGSDKDEVLRNTIGAKADAIWRKTPQETPLFSFAGVCLSETIIIPDQNKPTGFAKIHVDHYTVGQLVEAGHYKNRKAAEAARAALKDIELADEAVRRADGDLTKRAADLAD